VASILVGLVGNLAANTIDEISAEWKPVIWVTLGVLAAAVTFSAVRNALRSARDSASGNDARFGEPAGRVGARRKRTAWQVKAMLVVWALLAVLGVVGTSHALNTPEILDIKDAWVSSFELKPDGRGGWDGTPLAIIAMLLAIFAWLCPPFIACQSAYHLVPVSAGPTVRGIAACVGFAFGGWAGFFGTFGGMAILASTMSPAAAICTTLAGIFAMTLVASGWTEEARRAAAG